MNNKRKKAFIALGLNVIIWGAAAPLVKWALPFTTPYRWLFYRYLIAAPLTFPIIIYYLIKSKKLIKKIFTIILLELIGTTVVLTILYEGLSRTSAIDASLISTSGPIFVIVGGIIFLKEKEEKREWIGLFVALFGSIIISIEPLFLKSNIAGDSSFIGNSLIFLQNIVWAIYLIIIKKVYKDIPKIFIGAISFSVGLVSFYVLSLITSDVPLLFDLLVPQVTISVVYMGILGSIVGLTLYLYGHDLIEASEAVLFTYLQPIITIPIAYMLLGDKLTIYSFIGILFIAFGVYLAEIRTRRV